MPKLTAHSNWPLTVYYYRTLRQTRANSGENKHASSDGDEFLENYLAGY